MQELSRAVVMGPGWRPYGDRSKLIHPELELGVLQLAVLQKLSKLRG